MEAINACVTAERALLPTFGGGCKVPVAAMRNSSTNSTTRTGQCGGTWILRANREGLPHDAENIGTRVADQLLQQGADKILKEFQ